jgi:transcriptional regulator with XRE-family HTH domain
VDRQPAQDVARNLRRLRAARALSLVALAERSGVAKATLAKLEAGRGNPTVETLYAVADALGAPLSELLRTDGELAGVEVLRAAQMPVVPGAVEARLLDRAHRRSLVELFALTVAERPREAGPHPPGVVEVLVVVEGRLRAGPAEAPVDLDAGDRLRFPGDRPHVYAGLGGPARAVIAILWP